jgi:hypothetical protein
MKHGSGSSCTVGLDLSSINQTPRVEVHSRLEPFERRFDMFSHRFVVSARDDFQERGYTSTKSSWHSLESIFLALLYF